MKTNFINSDKEARYIAYLLEEIIELGFKEKGITDGAYIENYSTWMTPETCYHVKNFLTRMKNEFGTSIEQKVIDIMCECENQ